MKRIQSKKHRLGTYEIDKISLSSFDDKRYVLDDGSHMLAYFHKDCVTICKKIVIKKKGLKKIVINKIVKRFKKIVTKKNRLKKIVIKKIVKRLHVSNRMNSVVM